MGPGFRSPLCRVLGIARPELEIAKLVEVVPHTRDAALAALSTI